MRLSFLLFLASILKLMAKPLQRDPIIAPSNYVGSEFDLDDAGTGKNTPSLLSPLLVQYIESSNPFQSAPIIDLGTNVMLSWNSILTLPVSIRILRVFPFPDPFTAPVRRVLKGQNCPTPYCPVEFAYCCTGDYAPETNKFVDGCSPCVHVFLLLFSPPVCCTND